MYILETDALKNCSVLKQQSRHPQMSEMKEKELGDLSKTVKVGLFNNVTGGGVEN